MFNVNCGSMASMHYTNWLCSLKLLSYTLFSMVRLINNSILISITFRFPEIGVIIKFNATMVIKFNQLFNILIRLMVFVGVFSSM